MPSNRFVVKHTNVVGSLQLSDAVGAVHVTMAPQSPSSFACVMSAGMPEIDGSSSSFTVTVKLIVVSLPAASSAVYITVVVPTSNVSPLLWVELRVVPGQLSSAVGAVQVTSALHRPTSLDTMMLLGVSEMVGASSSVTVMVKLAVDEFPWMSVAV